LFELLGDRVGNQLGVGFRLANFFDVDVHGHAHQALEVRLQDFDVFTALADHDARASRINRDACVLGGTLDDDAANGRALEFLLQGLTYPNVLGQHAAELIVVGIPARRPVAVDREAEPNRVYFLSHCDSLSSDFDHNVASLLLDTVT